MPVIYRDDGSVAWGMLAIFMVVLVVILMVGYFAWYQPSYTRTVDGPDTTIVNPAPSPAPAPAPAPTVNVAPPNVNVTTPAPQQAPNTNINVNPAPTPSGGSGGAGGGTGGP